MIWYSCLFKNFSQSVVIHTVKMFDVVNEAEVDVFLEFPCFLYDATNIGNLISGSSVFSKPSLYIWNFLIQVLLKPSMKDFEHNLTSMENERNCLVVWTFFSTALLWDWDGDWALPVLASWSILMKGLPNSTLLWLLVLLQKNFLGASVILRVSHSISSMERTGWESGIYPS